MRKISKNNYIVHESRLVTGGKRQSPANSAFAASMSPGQSSGPYRTPSGHAVSTFLPHTISNRSAASPVVIRLVPSMATLTVAGPGKNQSCLLSLRMTKKLRDQRPRQRESGHESRGESYITPGIFKLGATPFNGLHLSDTSRFNAHRAGPLMTPPGGVIAFQGIFIKKQNCI